MGDAEAVALIQRGQRFLVAGHRSPDADALGSAVGLASVLRSLGKEAVLYVPDALPDSVGFLLEGVDFDRVVPAGVVFDATFVMDTAAVGLLPEGLPEAARRGALVVIDHHAHHDAFGDVVVRDLEAAATGEVVLRLVRSLGLETISSQAATALYAALAADTGSFRYSNTRGQTLRSAAWLVECGADPFSVSHRLFEAYPRARLELLREVLGTLDLHCDGRVATLRAPRELVERAGASDDMVNGLVNYARGLRGVEAAVLFSETRGGAGEPAIRLSLRSHGPVDVGAVASSLGGGGHRAAAGATVAGPMDAAVLRVVEALRAVLCG